MASTPRQSTEPSVLMQALVQGISERAQCLRKVPQPGLLSHLARTEPGLHLSAKSLDRIDMVGAVYPLEPLKERVSRARAALRPGGVLFVASIGPSSLLPLRPLLPALYAGAWSRLMDMHDLGDLMVSQGLADPVLESEVFEWTYSKSATALMDLRQSMGDCLALGAFADRTWASRLERNEWISAIERLRRPDGRISMAVELIFGHAWRPLQSKAPGSRPAVAPVRFRPKTPNRFA
ncbi:MAG: hypothetical protein RLY67_64 [Pseudomonadota bacterium]